MRYTPMQIRESFDLTAQPDPAAKAFPADPAKAEKVLAAAMFEQINRSIRVVQQAYPVLGQFVIDYKIINIHEETNFARFRVPPELKPFAIERQTLREGINKFISDLRVFAEDPDTLRPELRDVDMTYTLYFKPEAMILALSNMAYNYFEATPQSMGSVYLAQHLLERIERFDAKLN